MVENLIHVFELDKYNIIGQKKGKNKIKIIVTSDIHFNLTTLFLYM